ncbi:HAD family hydrolase [Oceaniglobus trochenteri]|uniref:HAD family hydrolase n=1 Tax=Oceaniglobus trochenteri TaxID=2763260 RepID=UPI001CFF7421|nr:HAD family hydrolase [Oceaniglobus trochenteri]
MTPALTTIAFDADDTLWHNETFFRLTQERFAALLADYAPRDDLDARLLAAERRNLGHYGFGIKGFVLSMIETAIDITDEKVPARVIRELVDAGRDMLEHPIDLLPEVEDTLRALSGDFRLLIITKGDLLDQERKVAQSGLGDLFDGVEIVSDKTASAYDGIFARHGTRAAQAMMVGNSMKSDVLPVLELGAWGVHVPHGVTWELERAAAPDSHPRFHQVDSLGQVMPLARRLCG